MYSALMRIARLGTTRPANTRIVCIELNTGVTLAGWQQGDDYAQMQHLLTYTVR